SRLGFFHALYGEAFPPKAPAGDPDPAKLIATARMLLWSSIIAAPLFVLCVVALFHAGSDTQPYQLGLTSNRVCRYAILGYLSSLALSPLVIALNYLVETLYAQWRPGQTETHPLFLLLQ